MPPAHVESHSCNLLDLASLVAPYLRSSGLKVLRATCREGRVQADRAITALTTRREEPSVDRAPGDDELVRCLRSVLSRGSRITKLLLHPDVDNDKAEPPAPHDNTARALRILEAFQGRQQPQPQQPAVESSALTLLSLRDVEFTDELAAAVGSAAPRLESLDIVGKNLCTAASLDYATPGLCRLITTCAPHLTSLAFKCELHSVTQPLADAIRSCSRLQHLECRLGDWWYDYDYGSDSGGDESQGENAPVPGLYATILLQVSVVRLAGVLSSLPSLRSLGLAYYYVDATHSTAAAICSMTQLTRLHFDSPWYGDTASILRLPRNLVHLTLQTNCSALQDDDVRLLASELSQLTHLSLLGRVRAMYDEPALPRRSLPLPPALRELHIGCSVRLRGLRALQLPPGLTWLSLVELNLTNQRYPAYLGVPDSDSASGDEGSGSDSASGDEGSGIGDEAEGDGAEGQAIGAAGGRAGGREDVSPGADGAVALPSLVPSFDEVLEALGVLHGRLDTSRGLVLGPGQWAPPPNSWPLAEGYGFVRLFGALRPLALRKLELRFGVLEARDVAAMVEQLPWLQELSLHNQVHPATVPLLSGLHSLEQLELILEVGQGTDAWSASATVSAALSPLLLSGPARPRVRIRWSYRDCMRQSAVERMQEAVLKQAVEGSLVWLRRALRGMGRDQRAVAIGTR